MHPHQQQHQQVPGHPPSSYQRQQTTLPPPDGLVAGAPSYSNTGNIAPPHTSYEFQFRGGQYAPSSSSTFSSQHQPHHVNQAQQHHNLRGQGHETDHYRTLSQGSQGPSMSQSVPTAGRPRSSWIPNLLGPDRAQSLETMAFSLVVRQQPKAARACGFGDRDRRVIDPPPIVQLKIGGTGLSEDDISAYLRYPSYVMNCSIWDESGTRDASYMPDEYQHQRRLMGSLVSSPFVGQDDADEEGCFFCFSDLSCRTPGAFRLKFTLIMIDPTRAHLVKHFPTLAETKTDAFHVYSAKEFPGMVASSELAKRLKAQGCIISIKKGNERARNARTRDSQSGDDDE